MQTHYGMDWMPPTLSQNIHDTLHTFQDTIDFCQIWCLKNALTSKKEICTYQTLCAVWQLERNIHVKSGRANGNIECVSNDILISKTLTSIWGVPILIDTPMGVSISSDKPYLGWWAGVNQKVVENFVKCLDCLICNDENKVSGPRCSGSKLRPT